MKPSTSALLLSRFLYWEFKDKQAVRMGDWKAVRVGGEDGRMELYDLESDLGEKHDLAHQQPEISTTLTRLMNQRGDAFDPG